MGRAARPGLILELPLAGDLADGSGAGRRVVAHGQVTFVAGRTGRCASFDGQTWVDTGVRQEELGDEFTVECWVNPGPQQGQHADIFGNHVSEGAGFVVQQDGAATNQFLAGYGAGPNTWVLTDAVGLTAGRWQHLALVKTRTELRLYVNGVLAAEVQDPTPARLSPMPVAVGLGYKAPERCFRGLIADLRVWARPLTEFGHAGIDPAAARATQAAVLDATPRPAAGPAVHAWALATDDTRLTLGVTAAGDLVLIELCCPDVRWDWVASPVAWNPLPRVEVGGQERPLAWRFADAAEATDDGTRLTLRFTCADPALEMVSQWHAGQGPGPIRHQLTVTNRGAQSVTVGDQATFDFDLAGAASLWCFHSDGITPDPVGVYRYALTSEPPGTRHTVRTAPSGAFIPYVVLEAPGGHALYLGLEWSFCRIETVALTGPAAPGLRLRAGNVADARIGLATGETMAGRPGFVGACAGDLDDAGNRLRRWLFRYGVPDVLRQDPTYPKVQWNAFGATGKTPGNWDPVEAKYYPLIDDLAPLGFEEVMIDVGWWAGQEPDSDPADWPSGMAKAADYAHAKGLRFGLYWTDDQDMATPAGRDCRAARIRRLFREYRADLWRSDCTRGEVIGASYAATLGFYQMLDALAAEIPGFQWENCCGGGRIKDYGAMRRAVKVFNSDTYSALHVRQAFWDSAYALHPTQIEGHLGSTDGRYRPRGAAGVRYAFRSTSMGAPEWFLDAPNGGNGSDPWTAEERAAAAACVATYKARIRPLVRTADLYHLVPRPDGRHRDAIQYWDPATGRGAVFLFQPAADAAAVPVRLRGLEADRQYRVTSEDGNLPPATRSGAELMDPGLAVPLVGAEASELIFVELVR